MANEWTAGGYLQVGCIQNCKILILSFIHVYWNLNIWNVQVEIFPAILPHFRISCNFHNSLFLFDLYYAYALHILWEHSYIYIIQFTSVASLSCICVNSSSWRNDQTAFSFHEIEVEVVGTGFHSQKVIGFGHSVTQPTSSIN